MDAHTSCFCLTSSVCMSNPMPHLQWRARDGWTTPWCWWIDVVGCGSPYASLYTYRRRRRGGLCFSVSEVFSTDTACYWSPDTFAVLCSTWQCSEEHTPHGILKRAFIPQRSISSKLQPDTSTFTTLHHRYVGRDGLQHSLNIELSRAISQHKIIGLYDKINVDFLAEQMLF